MKAITQNIGVVVAVVMIAISILVYKSFFQGSVAFIPDALPASNIGSEALSTLNGLQQVALDQSLFSDNGYIMLVDLSTTIPPQPTGRANPFNVIGR